MHSDKVSLCGVRMWPSVDVLLAGVHGGALLASPLATALKTEGGRHIAGSGTVMMGI